MKEVSVVDRSKYLNNVVDNGCTIHFMKNDVRSQCCESFWGHGFGFGSDFPVGCRSGCGFYTKFYTCWKIRNIIAKMPIRPDPDPPARHASRSYILNTKIKLKLNDETKKTIPVSQGLAGREARAQNPDRCAWREHQPLSLPAAPEGSPATQSLEARSRQMGMEGTPATVTPSSSRG
jgi:hypothetical protein